MRPAIDAPPPHDLSELTTVIERLHGRMVGVATRVLHDDDEARDAVQDAYLLAVRHFDRFDGRAKLSSWLHRIVVNASLMRLRTRRRRPTESFDETALSADAPGMEATLHRRRVHALVRRSLASVRPEERLVLTLRDMDGHDTAHVARTLRVTPGAVKVRAFRARRALRRRLLEHGTTSAARIGCVRPEASNDFEWALQEVS